MLSSPLSYDLISGLLWLGKGGSPSPSTGWAVALRGIRRAFTGKAPVVWSSAFFPVELAWSLGLCPFSPEVAAAYIVDLGFGEEMLAAV